MSQNLKIFVKIGSVIAVVNLQKTSQELTPVLFIFIIHFG